MLTLGCMVKFKDLVLGDNAGREVILNRVESVRVEGAFKELAVRAWIVVASKTFVRLGGKRWRLAELLRVGQRIEVWMGYNERGLNNEFSGFVAGIKPGVGVTIYCEDGMWLLKRILVRGTMLGRSVREFLEDVLQGGRGIKIMGGSTLSDLEVGNDWDGTVRAEDSKYGQVGEARLRGKTWANSNRGRLFRAPEAPVRGTGTMFWPSGEESFYDVLNGRVLNYVGTGGVYGRANPAFSKDANDVDRLDNRIRELVQQIKIAEGYNVLDQRVPMTDPIMYKPMTEVLDDLRRRFGIYCWFRGMEIHVSNVNAETGVLQVKGRREVQFLRDWNIVSHNLEFKEGADTKTKVVIKSIANNGRITTVDDGVAYGNITRLFVSGYDKEQLQAVADSYRRNFMYAGLRGSFTAFGSPFLRYGDVVILRDVKEEITGDYMAMGTKVDWSSKGFRRTIELGPIFNVDMAVNG